MKLGDFEINGSDIVAAYAALVATGALCLEVRRWFEGRARLALGVSPEMATVGVGGLSTDRYLIVNVSNRGSAPTTVTHFALMYFPTLMSRIQNKAVQEFIVAQPNFPGGQGLPHVLEPGHTWSGIAKHDAELKELINSGDLWVAIYGSHAKKPTFHRVHKPILPTDAKQS